MHDILVNEPVVAYAVYNVANPNPVLWPQIIRMLQNTKVFSPSIKQVSMTEWIDELQKSAVGPRLKSLAKGIVYLPFFETLAKKDIPSRFFKTEKGIRASKSLETCPEFSEAWMQLYVDAWRRSGFLLGPTQ